jgi:hypothetical protein
VVSEEAGLGAIMLRIAVILVAILAFPITARTQDAASCVQPSPRNAEKCARIALAQEFVRELEILQQAAKQELAEDSSGPGKLATSMKVRTRMLFEMNDSINRLSMINVDAKWAEFRDALKKLHRERIVLLHEMNQMSKKTLLAGAEPDVNYGKLTAPAPEITAQVEQIDKIIFTIAKAMFFALVDDDRVGRGGKLHHLLLTKKERTSMVQLIDKMFGPKTLEDKNSSHIVAAAWVIKYGLTRPQYKAADEL